MKIVVMGNVLPWNLVHTYENPHLQVIPWRFLLSLKIEAAVSSERAISIYQTAWCHVSEHNLDSTGAYI
jgi:hypothetical protein